MYAAENRKPAAAHGLRARAAARHPEPGASGRALRWRTLRTQLRHARAAGGRSGDRATGSEDLLPPEGAGKSSSAEARVSAGGEGGDTICPRINPAAHLVVAAWPGVRVSGRAAVRACASSVSKAEKPSVEKEGEEEGEGGGSTRLERPIRAPDAEAEGHPGSGSSCAE